MGNNTKKIRLLELISKKDDVLKVSNWHWDLVYVWLEELEYLLNLLNPLPTMGEKVMETIRILREGNFQTEKISKLKAQLEVFKRYEIEGIEFK